MRLSSFMWGNDALLPGKRKSGGGGAPGGTFSAARTVAIHIVHLIIMNRSLREEVPAASMKADIRCLCGGVLMASLLVGCTSRPPPLWTFADFPGFRAYTCATVPGPTPDEKERLLLSRFRPRIVVAPGAPWPIDFYRDYLPHTVLRDAEQRGRVIARHVTREVLRQLGNGRHCYLDLVQIPDLRREGKTPVVYGRIYRERVTFSNSRGETTVRSLIFLKYTVVFAVSGLPAGLPWIYDEGLRLLGLNPEDWHQLDNFCAVHVVLDEGEQPVAVLLAQHNYHRTYLVGRDIPLPADGRMIFAAAQRSNELYPDTGEAVPVFHRAIPWPLYTEYLLSGQARPWFAADDLTYGQRAGGEEVEYELQFLDPCDPFYTSRCMLGAYRPFWGIEIGRNGPPGADYYTLPELIPLGDLLKASYLQDGKEEDIRVVRAAMNRRNGSYDVPRLLRYGEQQLYHDVFAARGRDRVDGGSEAGR
jgi:hypothetical protein